MNQTLYNAARLHEQKKKSVDMIIEEMRERGMRITGQRRLIIDIILSNECASCKEIYYRANQKDSSIGIATVYRMVKTLEEIGAIDRRNMYKVFVEDNLKPYVQVELRSHKKILLTAKDWEGAVQFWLEKNGLLDNDKVQSFSYNNF